MIFKNVCISGMLGVSDQNLADYKHKIETRAPGSKVDILTKEILSEDDAIARMQGYDVLVSGYQKMTDRVYAETQLKAFIVCSIGYDFVNVDAADKHNIVVANNPTYCVSEVAEHICALTLTCARNVFKMANAVKNGEWGFPVIAPQQRFSESVVGFYGFGRIPRMAAKKLSGFEAKIIACDPYLKQEQIADTGVTLVSFDEMLERSDYVVVQVPLSPETTNVFNASVFKKMKKTACLINTARGPLVNQKDLYEALTTGEIRGAALDVLCHEPAGEEEKKLIALDNVICTGHTGFYSVQSLEEQNELTVQNVLKVLNGELPDNFVNKGVVERLTWYHK